MSAKDQRYFRNCPICDDLLVGTDDGESVFLSLQEALTSNMDADLCCTLCGEEVSNTEARTIVDKGCPPLKKVR